MNAFFRGLILVTPLCVAPVLACAPSHGGCSYDQPLGLSTSPLSAPLADGGAPDASDDAADASVDHTGDPVYDIRAACDALRCRAPDTCVVHSNVPGGIQVECGIGPC